MKNVLYSRRKCVNTMKFSPSNVICLYTNILMNRMHITSACSWSTKDVNWDTLLCKDRNSSVAVRVETLLSSFW